MNFFLLRGNAEMHTQYTVSTVKWGIFLGLLRDFFLRGNSVMHTRAAVKMHASPPPSSPSERGFNLLKRTPFCQRENLSDLGLGLWL